MAYRRSRSSARRAGSSSNSRSANQNGLRYFSLSVSSEASNPAGVEKRASIASQTADFGPFGPRVDFEGNESEGNG